MITVGRIDVISKYLEITEICCPLRKLFDCRSHHSYKDGHKSRPRAYFFFLDLCSSRFPHSGH